MKNQRVTISTICLLLLLSSGCMDSVLNRKPLNVIPAEKVWKSKDLVKAYLVSLYDALPTGFPTSRYAFGSFITGESALNESSSGFVHDFGQLDYAQNTGMYTWIRKANYFLAHIKKGKFSEEYIRKLMAEVRFIRAYYYYDLVKKYGGMPIIKKAQKFNNNLDELQVSRDDEIDVWSFILSELNYAIKYLPESRDEENKNRANKYIALALKSRAMLYAGSIAKYGDVRLNGILGIPSNKADLYFKESLNASQKIMDSDKYTLYTELYNPATKSGDPAANYRAIFRDEGNNEVIFQVAYSYPDKPNNYVMWNIPEGFTTHYGSTIAPLWEMVSSYEFIDGGKGTLDASDVSGIYSSPTAIFEGVDPRLEATILHGGSSTNWGRPLQIYRGIYVNSANGKLYNSLESFPLDPSRRQVGLNGPYPTGNFSKTGFYIAKYMNMDERITTEDHGSVNYIELRYAEILLNFAEAALELGVKKNKALHAINLIRDRAGISLLGMSELTISKVRHERKIELAFEGKRFWDIRRWRIGIRLFQNKKTMHGLWPYLIYETNTDTYKYIYKIKGGYPIDNGLNRIFRQRDYYSDLAAYTEKNPNMTNNPGW